MSFRSAISPPPFYKTVALVDQARDDATIKERLLMLRNWIVFKSVLWLLSIVVCLVAGVYAGLLENSPTTAFCFIAGATGILVTV